MAIQIGAKPDSGFDDPLGMLMDCHRRIEHFLNILCVVASRAEGRPLSDEEATAVRSALQYFRSGGERHTADEEESLFPRLKNGEGGAAFEELARLEKDHQAAGELHRTVETLYLKWTAEHTLTQDENRQLTLSTQELTRLYREHIKVEEETVFPHALKALDSHALEAIGQEFRARRK